MKMSNGITPGATHFGSIKTENHDRANRLNRRIKQKKSNVSRSQSAIDDAHKREERNEAALGPCNSDRSHNPGISSARSFRRPPRFASGPRISAAAPRFAWRYEGTGACVLCCCLSPRFFCFFFLLLLVVS